ncbi:MAG: FUSC family protein [Parvibaculum sp.]
MPGWKNHIFAVKAFAAAMLALYIAFVIGLPKPSWAMTTALIVAQPFAGMVLSKAVYRLGGTFIGAIMAGFALIGFAGAPGVQVLVLASWVGLCVYLSCLDRTPRAYAFILAGYTAAIIGFPAVEAPLTVFQEALARCEEISLGILCATFIHAIVLPRRVGPVMAVSIADWYADATQWVEDLLIRPEDERQGAIASDRRKLISEAAALERLRVHALYDSPRFRRMAGTFAHLQENMQLVFSYMMAIEDRLTILRNERPDLLPGLRDLRIDFANWFRATTPDNPLSERMVELRAKLARLMPTPEAMRGDEHVLLYAALLQRMDDMLVGWQRGLMLRGDMIAERPARERPLPRDMHVDTQMAALAGFTTSIMIMLICAFWIATAWPYGSIAAMMVAVACALSATFDDRAGFVLAFSFGLGIGTIIGGFYFLGVLPAVTTFAMLVLVFAPFYLLVGSFVPMPAYAPLAFPVLIGVTAILGLENGMSFNFAAFLNGALAQMAGLAVTAMALRLARASTVEHSIGRIVMQVHRDLGLLVRDPAAMTPTRFVSLMHDRVDALLQRRGGGGEYSEQMIDGALAALRFGFNLRALHQWAAQVPPERRQVLDEVFKAMAAHFAAGNRDKAASFERVTAVLGEGMEVASGVDTERASQILIILSQIRHIMRHHVVFFQYTGARPLLPDAIRYFFHPHEPASEAAP